MAKQLKLKPIKKASGSAKRGVVRRLLVLGVVFSAGWYGHAFKDARKGQCFTIAKSSHCIETAPVAPKVERVKAFKPVAKAKTINEKVLAYKIKMSIAKQDQINALIRARK